MAKCVSHLMSSMRGSIAGVTYLTTPSGQIIARQRTRPAQPYTNPQQLVRNEFGSAVVNWNILPESDREKWKQWGEQVPGNVRSTFIGGITLARYLNEALSPLTPVNVDMYAPTYPGLPLLEIKPVAYAGAVGTTGFTIRVSNWAAMQGFFTMVRSGAVNPARYYFRGPFQSNTMLLPIRIPAFSIGGGLSADFTFLGCTENAKYFCRTLAVSDPDPDDDEYTGTLAYNVAICSAIAETQAP